MTRSISLEDFVIQERANGVSIIHRGSGEEWRFPNDIVGESDYDVLRRGDAVTGDILGDHEGETSGIHGVGETDSIAGLSDVLREVREHSEKENGVHGVSEGDTIATEDALGGKADLPHGDDAHTENYALRDSLIDHNDQTGGVHGIPSNDAFAAISDLDEKADTNHGNEEHSVDFATDADIDGKSDRGHGNEDHSEDFITGITALNDETNLGEVNRVNFRDNFVVQMIDDEVIVDSSGGVSDDDFSSHIGDNSAHHSRYSDSEARSAVSEDLDPLLPKSGGRTTGPIIQEHEQNVQTHTWTRCGAAPIANESAYVLLAEEQQHVRVVGTFVGIRAASSNRSYAQIGITFGSNTEEDQVAEGTLTRLGAWEGGDPEMDFAIVEYDGTRYYALELSTDNHYNYNEGIFFSGIARLADFNVIHPDDADQIIETDMLSDRMEISGNEVYHEGNINPSEQGHDHSGETISPDVVEADEIQLPTYPDGEGQGSIWLVE